MPTRLPGKLSVTRHHCKNRLQSPIRQNPHLPKCSHLRSECEGFLSWLVHSAKVRICEHRFCQVAATQDPDPTAYWWTPAEEHLNHTQWQMKWQTKTFMLEYCSIIQSSKWFESKKLKLVPSPAASISTRSVDKIDTKPCLSLDELRMPQIVSISSNTMTVGAARRARRKAWWSAACPSPRFLQKM